jgi:hypothetical protein
VFNGLPLPDFDDVAQLISPQQRIEGNVYLCLQSALHFGQDKKQPAQTRSVVTARSDGKRIHLAPASGLNNEHNKKYGFELKPERMIWSGPRPETLWAMYPFEVVIKDRLVKAEGYLTPRGKQDFKSWIANTVLPHVHRS